MMAAWKVAPALAAGNCVILKPAEQASLSSIRLAALAEEAAIDITAYPALAAWRERIRQLPGYVPPGP
ncbi:hypothetical protein G6F55_014666 [Rhizopus delemar]|nr:hypothetical protein G6F23_015288 [Rhizopus arrhizus]KAG1433692.1 hypothetical protein G6F55_014666 [Rhizopus delemar]